MIKNECEIVKDLMPNYIEDLANQGTKNFIEEHLKKCEPCNEMLENLKKEQKEEKKGKQNGEIEINHLKKYHKQVEKLKTVLFTTAIVIILICLTILGKVINENIHIKKLEKEGKKVIAMIEEVELDTKIFIELRDYELILEKKTNIGTPEENKKTYVYKKSNGNFFEKYVEESKRQMGYSYKAYLFKDSQTLKGIFEVPNEQTSLWETNISNVEKGIITCDGFSELKTPIVCAEQVRIREEEWEGQKCKVFSRHIRENCHYELWVEEERNIIIRDLVIEYGKIKEEKNYTWKEGTVSDKEIFDGASVEEIKNKYYDLNKKANKVAQIVNEAYPKTKEILESENYTLIAKTKKLENGQETESKKVYKVRNNKYAIADINEGTVTYGIPKKEYAYELEIKDGKILQINAKYGNKPNFNLCLSGVTSDLLLSYSMWNLSEEKFNGQECYAVSSGFITIWINKESKLIVGEKWQDNIDEKLYTYTWEIGNVTDKDVLKQDTIEEAKKAYGYVEKQK